MPQLLGPNGRPIKASDFTNKKAPPPKTGEAFGQWAGSDADFARLPGGGVVQFDLSKLTLPDFRAMRDHYQVNASLSVLTFMLHQVDFHVECEDKKIADLCERQLREIWTPLNRSLGTANWAGFSPNALNWENDTELREVRLDKIKDLYPEECRVHWKLVDGYAPPGFSPPKFKVFDGIHQSPGPLTYDDEGRIRRGYSWPIPVENSFWYPLLMENGDYSGRKLLRPAFTSWFFSVLVHLFANRYYERFGEPTPVGRAPYDEEFPGTPTDGEPSYGNVKMLEILSQLRNRGVVVLPNDRTPTGAGTASEFDYTIEYLESQMRGADFERYLTRLDEEVSLGIFTPILLMRTADVGSYNLGVGHMQIWLWMLNAICGDRKQYIDKYILRKMTDYNFSPKAPSPKIVFKKLGDNNMDMLQAVIVELIKNDKAKPDLQQLGELAGLTLTQVKQLADNPTADAPPTDNAPPTNLAIRTATDIIGRVQPQIENAFRDGKFGPELKVNMGYKRKLEKALEAEGTPNAVSYVNRMYERMDRWVQDVCALGPDEISGPDSFMDMFEKVLTVEIGALP